MRDVTAPMACCNIPHARISPRKIAFTVEQSLEPVVLKRTCLSCKASRDVINTEQSKPAVFTAKGIKMNLTYNQK